MLSLRTRAASAARRVRVPSQRQARRYAHDAAHDSHGHGHAAPASESFSTKFFVGLGAIPAAIVLYKFAPMNSSEDPWLTSLIGSYTTSSAEWAERNDLHTKMVEQAGADRNLFIASAPNPHIDLRFPEAFNTGSPWNVPAGQSANLDKLVAHYEKKNYEAQAAKLEALANGTLKVEQEASKSE